MGVERIARVRAWPLAPAVESATSLVRSPVDRLRNETRSSSPLARAKYLLLSLVGGAVWGIVSFVAFWYVVLPIARNGAPFRATSAQPTLSVAPNWLWILGFTLFGLVTGAVYGALHRPHLVGRDDRSTEDEFGKKLEYAA